MRIPKISNELFCNFETLENYKKIYVGVSNQHQHWKGKMRKFKIDIKPRLKKSNVAIQMISRNSRWFSNRKN